ncbi:MAG: ferredoxin [Bacilli bacterium]|nr:ferredoxin [Bacilli bacterium]
MANFKVDQDKCLRCGMCTGTAMDIFEFDDEGNIKVNNEQINDENIDEVNEAMNNCPVGAISEE